MKASLRSIRALAVLLALLAGGASAYSPAVLAQSSAAVQSPEQFFGFQMGADRKLANWDKLHQYYEALAKASNKLRVVELGKSSEGRPYLAIFISSPANLARLEQLRQLNARLADPRGMFEAEARKLVADGLQDDELARDGERLKEEGERELREAND